MKYQPKYTSQGQSKFFADGRSNRLPPEFTIPFDGTDYIADAGHHAEPEPGLPEGRPALLTSASPTPTRRRRTRTASRCSNKPVWKDGKLAGRGVLRRTTSRRWRSRRPAGGNRSSSAAQQQFNVNCAICHGTSGRGGGGEIAYGIVGAYGLSVAPSNIADAGRRRRRPTASCSTRSRTACARCRPTGTR